MFRKWAIVFRLGLLVMLLFSSGFLFAQDSSSNSVGGIMRSNDKIYVVMAICITILAGLIFYAIRIERKITKIEKNSP